MFHKRKQTHEKMLNTINHQKGNLNHNEISLISYLLIRMAKISLQYWPVTYVGKSMEQMEQWKMEQWHRTDGT